MSQHIFPYKELEYGTSRIPPIWHAQELFSKSNKPCKLRPIVRAGLEFQGHQGNVVPALVDSGSDDSLFGVHDPNQTIRVLGGPKMLGSGNLSWRGKRGLQILYIEAEIAVYHDGDPHAVLHWPARLGLVSVAKFPKDFQAILGMRGMLEFFQATFDGAPANQLILEPKSSAVREL